MPTAHHITERPFDTDNPKLFSLEASFLPPYHLESLATSSLSPGCNIILSPKAQALQPPRHSAQGSENWILDIESQNMSMAKELELLENKIKPFVF